MNKIIGIIACSLVASYSFAQQKRPLDIKACSSWNRIDNAKISPTGRYVTCKIVPMTRVAKSQQCYMIAKTRVNKLNWEM